MFPFARRWLPGVAAIAVGAALAGGGAAAPVAAAARGNDPTITIRVGGIRTAENGPPGPPTATGLAGVTFRVTPTSAGYPDTCVSTSAGLCTLTVNSNKTYTLTQTGTPSGWFASTVLDVGTVGPSSPVAPKTYDTLSVSVGTSDVTVPTPAPNSDTSPTARSGTWALSDDDPPLPEGCGLRIALLFDLSSSVTSAILPTYKAAGRAFVDALKGTPSNIAVYTFGTTAPASGASNTNLVPPVSVATEAGVTTLNSKINGLTVPSASYTNWDAGLWQIEEDNAAYHYQAAIILTDGDPTKYGPASDLGGVTVRATTRFAEIENGIFSANALKDKGTSALSVGIGTQPEGLEYVDNIKAISGPTEDVDYFNTDFARLHDVLTELALRNCAGIDLTKSASPATYTHAGEKIDYTYTATNTKFFTLHDVHVADDHISGSVPCTPSTFSTDETATCHATYTITQADVDAGHVTNTATAIGTTPNDNNVVSPSASTTVTAIQTPGIHLAKSAFPTEYAVSGEEITYTYTVTNTGNVTLHGIALTDSNLGAVTCPETALAPGASTTCQATHTTTQADVNAGHITNTATVTGHPPTGPPVTDAASDTVTAIHAPGIELEKSAFPTEYAVPGEVITYTYTVVNTGNVALHGIALTDDKFGAVTCPETALAPGASTTCQATHTTTQADVNAGHITNTATVTGHPPTGPPVTDAASDTVTAIHAPGIELEKSGFPATYSAPWETITYTYVVVNTGNATLHGITLTDNKLGAVTCPATVLAAGGSMACHATHTTTQADVSAGHITNTATVTGYPPAGSPVTGAAEATILLASWPVPVTG
jgi:hypothetical protein